MIVQAIGTVVKPTPSFTDLIFKLQTPNLNLKMPASQDNLNAGSPAKKGRGRPRKNPPTETTATTNNTTTTATPTKGKVNTGTHNRKASKSPKRAATAGKTPKGNPSVSTKVNNRVAGSSTAVTIPDTKDDPTKVIGHVAGDNSTVFNVGYYAAKLREVFY